MNGEEKGDNFNCKCYLIVYVFKRNAIITFKIEKLIWKETKKNLLTSGHAGILSRILQESGEVATQSWCLEWRKALDSGKWFYLFP